MNITFLNQTHTLNTTKNLTFQTLKTCVNTNFKNLPNNYMIICCQTKQTPKTIIKCQKDLQNMMKTVKGQCFLKIQQKNDEQYPIIRSDQKNSDFEDIVSQKDEDTPQVLKTINMDEIICNKLQQLLPAMIDQMKNQLKSGTTTNKPTLKDNNFDNRLMNMNCQLKKNWMKQCEVIMLRMKKPMNQMEEVCQLQKYFNCQYNKQMCQLQKEKQRIMEIFCIMNECSPKHQVQCHMKEMNSMHNEILMLKDNQWKCMLEEKNRFQLELCVEQKQFRNMLNSWMKNMETVKCQTNMNNHTKMMNTCMEMWNCLQTYEEQAHRLNRKQKMFCLHVTDYSNICCWMKQIQVYKCFWQYLNTWECCYNEWMNCCIQKINLKNVQQTFEKCCNELCWVMRNIKCQKMMKNCQQMMQKMNLFKKQMPLMTIVAKEGMCDRHWNQINQKCNVVINGKCSFKNILHLGLMNHEQYCLEVSKEAQREYQIQLMLKNIQEHWRNERFCLQQEKYQMCFIKNTKNMMQCMEKDLVCLKNMQFNVCAKNFEQKICEWKNHMMKMCNMMQKYQKLEKYCRDVSPLCESPLCQQIPKLQEQYKTMLKLWRQVMNIIELSNNVYNCCCSQSLWTKLQLCCNKLECLDKLVNNHIQEKKRFFPRLHFLSCNDVLELCMGKNFNNHFYKCFEGIRHLEYDEKENITHMVSQEGEKVKLCNPIPTKGKKFDVILKEIQTVMKQTVRFQLQRTVNCFNKTQKRDLIKNYPSQCALIASQIWWACQTQKSFKNNCLTEQCEKQNSNISELVKITLDNLTKNERNTLCSLLNIKVHERDLVFQYKSKNVNNVNDFMWQKMVRHYWNKDKCQIRTYLSQTKYCNEYLGCVTNLVITPLTDKCYTTLMTCMKQGVSCSHVGPAGTGKTQTMKDFAKTIGQLMIVINSSDQINYKTNEGILQGVASSGIWCCYDQFNRISLQVLSAFAQQLKKVEECRFKKVCCLSEQQFQVKQNFFVGVTYNPAYAGRTQLPEPLKQCFRSVAMTVPNFLLIVKNMLYSNGFLQGSMLAEKMCSCYTLFREQLTKQDHYDFGLRNIKATVNLCSQMRKQYPQMNEQQIVCKCMRKINEAKIVKQDLCTFDNIIKENFLPVYNCKMNPCNLKEEIKICCEKNNLECTDKFMQKVHQIQYTTDMRHSMMLIGQTKSGKSAACQIAAQSKGNNQGINIQRHIFNPKSMTPEQLYGCHDKKNNEWKDGVFTSIMRECSKDNSPKNHWITFDGPVDALYVEAMNTVMDDNKKLCLPSNELIPLNPNMKIVFQVEDVAVASPATVSRCGMVHFNCEEVGTEVLVHSWIKELPQIILNKQKMITSLKYLLNDYICECFTFMQSCKMIFPFSKQKMMEDLLKLLKYCMMCCVNECMTENMEKNIVQIFHWCIVCCFGNLVVVEERKKFDMFLKDLCMKKMRKIFPDEGCVFDYQYNIMNNCWTPWMKCPQMSEVICTDMNKCMVPTKDFMRNQMISKVLLKNECPVLLVGPNGTGKTLQCEQMKKMFNNCEINMRFSVNTSSQNVYDSIMCNLQKRRKNCYGPPMNNKCLVTIDDMNLPKKEVYGAMPPLQFIRYLIEYKKIWNTKNLTKYNVQDCTFMGVISEFYCRISNRVLSKFNMIQCPQPCDQTMNHVFETMLSNKLKKYPENIRSMKEQMSNSCVELFRFARKNFQNCIDEPSCHVTFKDACRVIQGICEMTPEYISNCQDMINLCVHENMRVYYDRLSCFENKKMMKEEVQKNMRKMITQCTPCTPTPPFNPTSQTPIISTPQTPCQYPCEQIVFVEFMNQNVKCYQPNHMNKLIEKMNYYVEKYNNQICYQPINMVISKQICQNISSLCQVLRKPGNNALLLGRDICGRKAITKMACYMMNCHLEEVMMNNENINWQKDMKKLMMKVICENKNTCIMVEECNMNEQMMSWICNMMRLKCPNFWTMQEMNKIQIMCNNECLERKMQMNPQNIMKICKQRLNKNLHWFMCLNPQPRNFRVVHKQFPALVSQCTVCWMDNCTQQSYLCIGKKVLQQKPTNETNWPIVKACMYIHQTMEKYQKQNNQYMCPQSSFVQFMNMCKDLNCQVQEKCNRQICNFEQMIKTLCCTFDKLKELKHQMQIKNMYPQMERCQKLMEKVTMNKLLNEKCMECHKWFMKNVYGSNVMKAAMMIYGRMLNCEERQTMKKVWKTKLNYMGVYCIQEQEMMNYPNMMNNCNPMKFCNMMNPNNTMQCDLTMRENMMVLENCKQIPIFMDPKNEMKKLMMNYFKLNGEQMTVFNCNTKDLLNNIRRQVLCGKWVFVQQLKCCQMNMMQELKKMNWRKVILCSNNMEMTVPPCCCKVNCTITPKRVQCLVTQCLMKTECCNLWNQMNQLCQNMKTMKEKMMIMNKKCYEMLCAANPDNICNNTELIEIMCCCETMQKDIQINMDRYRIVWNQCNQMMKKYQPVACHAASLYQCLCQMQKINPHYHYSCEWFMNFFCECMKKCEPSYMVERRVMNMIQTLNECCYQTVTCELFEKHRILFSFLMTTKMMKNNCQMNDQYWNYLITFPCQMIPMTPNPCDWLSNECWNNLYRQMKRLECMFRFKGICQNFMKNPQQWKKVCDSCTPWLKTFPCPYNELNMVQKMMIVKALCPEQMMPCMVNFIKIVMGEKGQFYVSNMNRKISSMIPYSNNRKPIMLMVSKDQTRPVIQQFRQCATQMNMKDKCTQVCLSQMTNYPKLMKMLEQAVCKGNWVYIQNLYLKPQLLQQINMENVHQDFRVWVPVYHHECVQYNFMNNCVKTVIQPEQNFQLTLMKTFNYLNTEEIMQCRRKQQCMKLLFGCCMLHTMILQRQKYKSQKWKCYQITMNDFLNCQRLVVNMLNDCEEIQWQCLRYMIRDICYGSKLLDEWHYNVLTQMVQNCLNKDMMKVGYCFSPSCDIYTMPEARNMYEYREHIKTLPIEMCPEHLGIPCNSEKINNIKNQIQFFQNIQMTNDMRVNNCNRQKIFELICCLQQQIPCMFNMQEVMKKYPICYDKPMNTFLTTETMRWNHFLKNIKNCVQSFKAMVNNCPVNDWNDDLQCVVNNKVPKRWVQLSFKSMKPLCEWMHQVQQKVNYIRNWVHNTQPMCIDVSMMMNPKTFFMCVKQCSIRKNWQQMNQVYLECKPMKMNPDRIDRMPECGFYVCGMWMQGACWNYENMRMVNCEPNMVCNKMPVFHMVPVCKKDVVHEEKCWVPLYQQQEWKLVNKNEPTLVTMLEIPCLMKQKECTMKNMVMFSTFH